MHDVYTVKLDVYTSHFSTLDPDRMDVTRGTGSGNDLAFAPSWPIVRAWKEALHRHGPPRSDFFSPNRDANVDNHALATHWRIYRRAYELEMTKSREDNHLAWLELLGRDRECVWFATVSTLVYVIALCWLFNSVSWALASSAKSRQSIDPTIEGNDYGRFRKPSSAL